MRYRLSLGAALLALCHHAAAAEPAPRPDCTGIRAPLERLICADPLLASLAAELGAAMRDAPGRSGDQAGWLAGRAASCPGAAAAAAASEGPVVDTVTDCLERIYAQRVAVLRYDRNRAAWPVLPFRPSIVEGAGKRLCEALRRDIEAGFLGAGLFVDPLGEREIGFAPMPGQNRDGWTASRADFDLYNRGRAVPVLRWVMADSGMRLPLVEYRPLASAAVLKTAIAGRPDDSAMQALHDSGQRLIDIDAVPQPDTRKPELVPWPYFTRDTIASVDRAPRFFRFGGRVYLLAALDGVRASPGDVGVYRLSGPAAVARECLFTGHVPIGQYDPQLPGVPDDMAATGELQSAAAPLLPVGKVCAAYGDGPRTLWDDRTYRPWVLELPSRPQTSLDPHFLALYMRNRGLSGLEQHRDHLAYVAARERAIAFLALYYATAFGRAAEDARRLAARYWGWEIAGGFYLDPDDRATAALLAPGFADAHAAQAAIFAGDLARLHALLGDDAKAAASRDQGPLDEPLVTDALDRPELLRLLLDAGADPDRPGASGRTPLMVAARLDLREAAATLLAHGAAIDAAAGAAVAAIYRAGDVTCGDPVANDTPGRTALSYAAALASPAMVRLLLDHAADPRKPDGKGRLPADYAADRADKGAAQAIVAMLRRGK